MKCSMSLKSRQGGAVAVMVGISMVALLGFVAMVIDLGHLYIVKTELQNAADAAALSGAKQLNGTLKGVKDASTNNGAVEWAIATAAQNSYNFSSKPVDITIDDIWVGDCPYDSCMVPASSISDNVAALGKTFLKVHTRIRDLPIWFASIWGTLQISTYGMAVAGRSSIDITALAVCKLKDDPTNPNVTELGYERGVSYNIAEINPLGGGNKFWLDPIEMPPTTCDPNNGNVPVGLPYMCAGKIPYMPVIGQDVYLNTGVSVPFLQSLNSRFNQYPSAAHCDPATAPPDSNIKEYLFTDNGVGSPSKWMSPDPVQQSVTVVNRQPINWDTRIFRDYGVLWSNSRPVVAAGAGSDAAVSSQWSALYQAVPGAATNYPQPSPSAQSGFPFVQSPLNNTPKSGRRILNMVIVDCPTGPGICETGKVRGIGQFFMQRQATNTDLYVEFAGLFKPEQLISEIRLYR
jgi:hypothetical protein